MNQNSIEKIKHFMMTKAENRLKNAEIHPVEFSQYVLNLNEIANSEYIQSKTDFFAGCLGTDPSLIETLEYDDVSNQLDDAFDFVLLRNWEISEVHISKSKASS